jgi:hypothetical protein
MGVSLCPGLGLPQWESAGVRPPGARRRCGATAASREGTMESGSPTPGSRALRPKCPVSSGSPSKQEWNGTAQEGLSPAAPARRTG